MTAQDFEVLNYIVNPSVASSLLMLASPLLPSRNRVAQCMTVHGSTRSYGKHKPEFKSIEVFLTPTSSRICVTLYEGHHDVSLLPTIIPRCCLATSFALICEVIEGWNSHVKESSWKLAQQGHEVDICKTFTLQYAAMPLYYTCITWAFPNCEKAAQETAVLGFADYASGLES